MFDPKISPSISKFHQTLFIFTIPSSPFTYKISKIQNTLYVSIEVWCEISNGREMVKKQIPT